MNEKKGGGLGDLEQNSTNYMSEYLEFGAEEEEDGECENQEMDQDLVYLKDPCITFETSVKYFILLINKIILFF